MLYKAVEGKLTNGFIGEKYSFTGWSDVIWISESMDLTIGLVMLIETIEERNKNKRERW